MVTILTRKHSSESHGHVHADRYLSDAIIPAEFMPGNDDADLGAHCFEYYRPEFRRRAAAGARIVYVDIICFEYSLANCSSVAENGFGSGSSREDAVRALKGAGIQAVVAKSFAFICMYPIYAQIVSCKLIKSR